MPGMDMPDDTKSEDSKSMPGMDMGSSSGATKMEHQMIKVSGNCEQCKDRIETAAKSVSGVSSADWSPETKMLHVQFNGAKTNSDAIQKPSHQLVTTPKNTKLRTLFIRHFRNAVCTENKTIAQ